MNLNWLHGNNLRAVIGPDKFCAADAEFAKPGLDFVILHSARLVGGGAIHELVA